MTVLLCFELALIFCWILFLICAFLELKENNYKSITKVEYVKWRRSATKIVNYKSVSKTPSVPGVCISFVLLLLFIVFTFFVH